jgi:hypothetical protein
VHANHWHFFRHFLRDATPAYTPEETERGGGLGNPSK